MNFALVSIVTVFLLVHEGKAQFTGAESDDVNLQPCQEKSGKSRYNEFVHRHILQETFNRTDTEAWGRYQ